LSTLRLPSKALGIESLRQKLCQRLFESSKRDLPQLIDEMASQLVATRRNIDQLGRVRKNAKNCLWYLSEIKSSRHQLASATFEGVYDDPNISAFFGKGDFTKLRNLITSRYWQDLRGVSGHQRERGHGRLQFAGTGVPAAILFFPT
jgi:hypothetical protein